MKGSLKSGPADTKKITDYFHKKKIPEQQKSNKVYKRPLVHHQKNKNNSKIKRDYRESSKQGSAHESNGTQKIQSEPQAIKIQVCQQLIMIGPADVDYFDNGQKKLNGILQNYSKKTLLDYILSNAKFMKIQNLDNLASIDDELFWGITVPKMLEFSSTIQLQQSISSSIQMLIPNQTKTICISRAQIMMILINMFFCTFPKQTHRASLSFNQLMQKKSDEKLELQNLRQQKLKCIIQYLKKVTMIKIEDLEKQFVQIQRVCNKTEISEEIHIIGYTMKNVIVENGFIQQKAGYDIMVDFANKKIGGGVLNNGAVQQEILFLKFPEMIAAMAVTYEIQSHQAIIIYGPKKWAEGDGYSLDFHCVQQLDEESQSPFPNIFIAIDAVDYSRSFCKGKSQYTTREIDRQILKVLTGFEGVEYGADRDMVICTGRWGCGAFKGDIYLKFLIQWIAASIAGRTLRYMSQDEEEEKQLKILVKFTQNFQSCQILQTILQFNKCLKQDKNLNFLHFFKRYLV